MITAEKTLHPNSELARFDETSKQPLHYNSGGQNIRNDRKHGWLDRQTLTEHGQLNQKRPNHQQAEFKGKCCPCGGSHEVKSCKDGEKKKHHCENSKLCHVCCLPGQEATDCSSWKVW